MSEERLIRKLKKLSDDEKFTVLRNDWLYGTLPKELDDDFWRILGGHFEKNREQITKHLTECFSNLERQKRIQESIKESKELLKKLKAKGGDKSE